LQLAEAAAEAAAAARLSQTAQSTTPNQQHTTTHAPPQPNTPGFLFFKGVTAANEAAEMQDRIDGYIK